MALKDKIKSDIQFRNKVIAGAIIFVVIMVVGIVGVLATNGEATDEQMVNTQEPMAVGVVPFDSTRVVPKKSSIYTQMDYFQEKNSKEIQIVDNEDIIGKTPEEIQQKYKEEDDEIASYMKQRRQKMNTTPTSTEPVYRERETSYTTTGSTNRRRYNPYASKEDWTEETPPKEDNIAMEKELVGYKTGREKQHEQKSKGTRTSRKQKPQSFDDLSPSEQKRILLETGKSHYEETEEFSAMIMSSGKVKNGDRITIITKEDAYINFEKIPKGTTITGIVSFGDNRLQVNFSTLRLKKKILKVDLTLYSLDGLAGLPLDSDSFKEDVEDTGINEVTQEVTGTRVGRIASSLFRGSRSRSKNETTLARDLMCILVNNNVEY